VQAYDKVGGNLIVVEPCPEGEAHKYGIVALDGHSGRLNRMTGMVEKPPPGTEPSNLFISGRYILQPEIFELLASQQRGAGGEIQLTDAMAKMIGHHPFHALTYTGQRYDCGSRIGFLEANVGVALSRAETAGETRALLERLLKG